MPNLEWEEEQTRVSRPEGPQGTERTLRMEGQSPGVPEPSAGATTLVIEGSPPSFAWLAILDGPRAGRLFRLERKGTTIGRDTQCDIVLDDESVSRQHSKVKAEEGGKHRDRYSVWDLASSNGTFVNDKRVIKRTLKDGDEIRIGRTTLVFKQV